MGKKEERINKALDICKRRNGITIHELAVYTGVSEITARRDVIHMEDMGQVNNIHGTVFYIRKEEQEDYSLLLAGNKYPLEKKKIGKYAASLIKDGEFVIIDNGTTTEQLAAAIPIYTKATVMCYNRNVINNLYLKPNIDLIVCGGRFHHQSQMFESPESLEMIRRTRANKVFVSAAGIHETLGVTCASEYEVTTKKEIVKVGLERILLVDSSKFDKVEPQYICELNSFEKIITDDGLPEKWQKHIRNQGIELILV